MLKKFKRDEWKNNIVYFLKFFYDPIDVFKFLYDGG